MKMIRFDQAFQDVTKDVTKIPRKEYLSHGRYPIVDQGDGKIAGYTNRNDGLYTDVPVVLFGDHTRVFKYVDFPFFAGADGTKILKARSGIDAHFGYYSFMQYPLISLGYSRHFKLLKERTFHTFDYATQLRIAGVLGSIDEKIELNRKKIAELEALAKVIYDYWFVQFDFPDANGKPYKSSGGKMVWNEQLKREVPEGWEVGPILNISELKVGGTPSKKEVSYWNGNIPFWGPTDFKSGIFQFHTAETITNMGFEHCSSDMLNEDATIITARGSIGKVAMAGRSMAMNQSCFAFEAYNNCSPFVYHLTRQLVAHLKNTSTGSVFNAFVASDLKNVFLLLGDSHVRRAYSELVQPMFDGIKAAVKTIDDLTGLRDSLLPLLMNGQVEMAG